MLTYVPFFLFSLITLFHIYMGVGGKLNYDYVLPKLKNGRPLPFHSLMALPVAFLLALSTSAFGFEVGILNQSYLGSFSRSWLILTATALVFRGCFGLLLFHVLNKLIDEGLFKTWDLRIYSPLTLFLGIASFKVLGFI